MISRSHQPLPNGLLVSPGQYGAQWWSKHAGAIGTLVVVWFVCLKHLAIEWNHNPEYQHGWIMPIAVAVLLFLRRNQRPFNPLVDHAMTRQRYVWATLLLLALWFPVRVIAQANPDWHLIGWITFFFALSLTCIIAHALGGNEAVRLYALPFIIIAAAIPLPYFFEHRLIAFLKELTATCSLEILHISGIAAFRESRDLIALKDTVLGIEDGCTGIRSLHLCLAAALFWGELHRLSLRTRAWLLLGGASLAVGVNVIRSVSLACLAEAGGAEKFHSYHEIVGLSAQALTLCLSALVLYLLLRPKENSSSPKTSSWTPHFLAKLPGGKPVRIPSLVFCYLVISVLIVEGGRMAWFKWHAAEARKTLWSFHTPRTIDDFREVAFPRKWGKSMSPDDVFSAEWKEGDHPRALHYMFWSSKNPSSITVRGHRPEFCLTGSGYELQGEPQLRKFMIDEFELLFHRYRFTRQGRNVLIYYGVWTADGAEDTLHDSDSIYRKERLAKAWLGQGNLGRRMMELGFWDTSVEDGDLEMEELLHQIIVPKEKGTSA